MEEAWRTAKKFLRLTPMDVILLKTPYIQGELRNLGIYSTNKSFGKPSEWLLHLYNNQSKEFKTILIKMLFETKVTGSGHNRIYRNISI